MSAGSRIGDSKMSSNLDSTQSDSSPMELSKPRCGAQKERSRQTKTNAHKHHQVGQKTNKNNAPPDSCQEKNAQPNDPRNSPKKKPRMGGRCRNRRDERRNPPPRRGWEGRDGSKGKPRHERSPRHDRSKRGLGPPRPDPADEQSSPHVRRMPPLGHRYPPCLTKKDPWQSER